MRMIDCFSEIFATTLKYVDAINRGENPDYDETVMVIERALSEHAQDYLRGSYSQEQYETAKYGVIAFIDEAFLSSSWQEKDRWKKEMLQLKYFNTVTAGKDFYNRLNELSAVSLADKDIREVYYYCMALGFRGKYFETDDHAKFNEIKNANLHLLTGGEKEIKELLKKPLFPDAYSEVEEGTGVIQHRNYTALYCGGSVTIILILFFVLKSRILSALDFLIASI